MQQETYVPAVGESVEEEDEEEEAEEVATERLRLLMPHHPNGRANIQ